MLGLWMTGLAVGAVSGLAPLALGGLGIFLALPGLGWATSRKPMPVALSGFLAGLGATWLVVWGRAIESCAGANTPSDGCAGPDLSGLSVVPIVVLCVAGLLALRRT